MKPLVSIIIPTKNEEGYIGKTLSHLRHSLPRGQYEIIVADDVSTDRTAEIAREYADTVLVRLGELHSIPRGKNAGAKLAHADYIAFLDADCEPEQPLQFFERALAYFEKHPKVAGITASLKVFPQLATWADRAMYAWVNLTYVITDNWLHWGAGSGEFQMVRRAAFDAIGGFREDLPVAEDQDLFQRMNKQVGGIRIVPDLVVWHTCRRAHKIGWPRLLYQWWTNAASLKLFNKSASKEWKVIR